MVDKLVVGRRAIGDGLKDMDSFAGNNAEVVFPEWKQKLFDLIKFECGRVAVNVIEGRFKAERVRVGEDIDTVTELVNMLIAKNRTGIKLDARWFENSEDRNVITQIGEMSMRAAVNQLKASYFDSIGRYALEEGTVVFKEYGKLRAKYDEDTLPDWLKKMDRLYGVKNKELYDAYVEQMTQLRVIKIDEEADIVKNLLKQSSDCGSDDVCAGFETFNDVKHSIIDLSEGISEVV